MTEQTTPEKPSRLPYIIAFVIVVALAAGGSFFLSGNGVAESEQDKNGQMTEAGEAPQVIKLGNPTVAVIGEEEIKRSDVTTYIGTLPENVQKLPLLQIFPLALEQVVNNKLVTMKAQSANLEEDLEVKQRIEELKVQVMRTVYIERQLDQIVTQKKLLKEYEQILDSYEGKEEIKARHILVETQEQAEMLIDELNNGADFVELAKEKSQGPTGPNGGDLGYFSEGEMVKEFSDAAFALQVGEVSAEPVQTQFGWHVIKIEDRRTKKAPEFEQVKEKLEAKVRQVTLQELLEQWRNEANIKMYDINGEPVQAN